MALAKCSRCGRLNRSENNFCEGCGEKLLRGQQYEQGSQSPPAHSSGRAQAPGRKLHGPPAVLLLALFALVGLVFLSQYTDLRPLDYIASLLGIGSAQTVAGRYDCHVEAENYPGVTQVEQTWSYVFHADGTYTTYLEGSQQYSEKWSQSANILTLHVPAIPGLSDAYVFRATVSRDASSFRSGKRTWIRVE